MKVLSVFNLKGGVGKTAASVNLSYLAAQAGSRVLLWDLDPQGAATFYFRVKPKLRGGSRKLAKGKTTLEDNVKSTDFERLDLLPADMSYRDLDVLLAKEKTSRLRDMIAPLKEDYDLLVIDCPPSMSALSDQVFRASNLLLVPIIPTTLSLRTLEQVRAHLSDNSKIDTPVRTIFSMVDRRKTMHREMIAETGKAYGKPLASVIPYSSVVERMGVERSPVVAFAARSAPSQAFTRAWAELSGDLKLPPAKPL